jgi:hypothetical protein
MKESKTPMRQPANPGILLEWQLPRKEAGTPSVCIWPTADAYIPCHPAPEFARERSVAFGIGTCEVDRDASPPPNLRRRPFRPHRPRRSRRGAPARENSHSLAKTTTDSIAPCASMRTPPLAANLIRPNLPLARQSGSERAAPRADRCPDRLGRRTVHNAKATLPMAALG